MSMTREEAIKILQEKYDYCKSFYDLAAHPKEDYPGTLEYLQALQIAISALRPITREQVEKVWRGCEYCKKHKINFVRIEMDYNDSPGSPERLNPTRIPKFCPICGAPMTDEAVEMVMERWEAMKDGSCD